MSSSPPDRTTLNGYQLRLPTFEGPLDVLLRLIERNQLVITDVSLVAVTDQFLAYVEDLGGAPPDVIAEFAAVGSRLVLIKSRTLLPRPPSVEEEAEPDDLARQLVEYRTLKEAAKHLETWDAQGQGAFARNLAGIVAPRDTSPPKLAAHQAGALARALRRRLSAVPAAVKVVTTRRVVSLREMVERILQVLPVATPLHFHQVAARCDNRHEVLTAFLAVLVLMRRQVVDAEQRALFGDITLRRVPVVAPLAVDDIAAEAADD